MESQPAAIPVLSCSILESPLQEGNDIQSPFRRRKRAICAVCDRPKESACFCSALPCVKIQLKYAYCIILQHPNEAKQHQNRSLPFIEHCIDSLHYLKIIARRFPSLSGVESDSCHTSTNARVDLSTKTNDCIVTPSVSSDTKHINETNKLCYVHLMNTILHKLSPSPDELPTIWLLSPNDKTSIPLTEALELWEGRKQSLLKSSMYPKIIVLVLDATWKFAKEMDRANIQHGCYPSSLLQRIQLTPSDFDHPFFMEEQRQRLDNDNDSDAPSFRRFSIRTPPKANTSDNIVYLSTAECLAYVLARIERQDDIYATIMKPLDLMVGQWHVHRNNATKGPSCAT